MNVKFVSVTPDAEKTMAYIARVSNPKNQNNDNYAKLLAYCIKHRHWSVFEQAFLTLEIETTRGIAAQILRHKSVFFQEFSQRYSDATELGIIPVPDLRRQDTKNRQNSIDDIPDAVKESFQHRIRQHFDAAEDLYNDLLTAGVARECARFVLPLATPTRMYMTASCRSWITYIALREKSGTQKEHMDIAKACKAIFAEQFPNCYEALGGDADWNI
jgi:thymidylate synthase (FAD)